LQQFNLLPFLHIFLFVEIYANISSEMALFFFFNILHLQAAHCRRLVITNAGISYYFKCVCDFKASKHHSKFTDTY